MSELSLERAVELVLAHPTWERCPACGGQGNISQKQAEGLNLLVGDRLPECETCKGDGYFRLTEMVEAYRITNTPYPDKPMSGPDYYKQTMRTVQNKLQETTQKYIGRVGVPRQQMVDDLTRVLEDLLPQNALEVAVDIDPEDSTRVHIRIGDKEKR